MGATSKLSMRFNSLNMQQQKKSVHTLTKPKHLALTSLLLFLFPFFIFLIGVDVVINRLHAKVLAS